MEAAHVTISWSHFPDVPMIRFTNPQLDIDYFSRGSSPLEWNKAAR